MYKFPSKRLVLITCLALALVETVVVLLKPGGAAAQASPPRDTSLLLLGFTNLPKGGFAIFCLSNGSASHIACVPEALEESSAGAWTRTPLTGRARRTLRDWIGVPEELKAGQAISFLVPPPTNGRAWRLVFMCQEERLLMDPLTNMVRHLMNTNAARVQSRQFSGRRYSVTSAEVAR